MKGDDVEKELQGIPSPHKNQQNHLNSPEKIFVETEKPWDDLEIQLDFWVPHRYWEGYKYIFSKMGLPLVQQQPHSWQSIKGVLLLAIIDGREKPSKQKACRLTPPPQGFGFKCSSTVSCFFYHCGGGGRWWQRIFEDVVGVHQSWQRAPLSQDFFGAGMWGGPTKKVDDTMSRPPSQYLEDLPS